MNATINTGLTAIITQLQKRKEELYNVYSFAINNGEKIETVKTLYLTLKDIDKKLNDLLRISCIAVQ